MPLSGPHSWGDHASRRGSTHCCNAAQLGNHRPSLEAARPPSTHLSLPPALFPAPAGMLVLRAGSSNYFLLQPPAWVTSSQASVVGSSSQGCQVAGGRRAALPRVALSKLLQPSVPTYPWGTTSLCLCGLTRLRQPSRDHLQHSPRISGADYDASPGTDSVGNS